MNELDLIAHLRATLITLLAEQGLTWDVTADYQPTRQGRNDDPTAYFFLLSSTRYGWQGRRYYYDLDTKVATREENQWHAELFQIQGLMQRKPTQDTGWNAHGMTEMLAMLIGSQGFRTLMKAEGINVGVQRITDIRNPQFKNDQDRFEQSPSFDFTLTHRRRIIQRSAIVNTFELHQTRV